MRIAIVNDQAMAVEALRRALGTVPDYQIAWVASDGREAVARCAKDTPDLILMDLVMPEMDGAEATRRIMSVTPCPILVVTATTTGHSAKVFEALGAGALDAENTPTLGGAGGKTDARALLAKIESIAKRPRGGSKSSPRATPPARGEGEKCALVVVGCSAGGPAALAELLAGLPPDFPAGVVIAQHVDAQFTAGLASWLGDFSKLPVRLAREGDRVNPGAVLIAASADHLVFKTPRELGYTPEPADYPYRPSVDALFESARAFWKGPLAGVLLTGMGRDGAKGLKDLRQAGHHTIAQDQASSAVYGMPKAAAALDAAVETLPLPKIAAALTRLFAPKVAR